MLAGAGRPIRQDEVFTVSKSNKNYLLTTNETCLKVESSVDLDKMKTTLNEGGTLSGGSTPGPFVIINIAADNANLDGQVS